ncbi:Probable dihydrofolate reductase protein [Polymorphum gilvum SL003B-26A1]|uniref:Dihydrofolate reductase n=1 Tax=Polymorphum gilvum (strain LMG 25793 / CGMCC 1.9160 / SL003B-26A1) TaxID=991905 RepID=F2J2A9_POLGS|nr:Probable dihydrofolate reductase protein [Polymorphum gilvum SL003B-26A1]
MIGADNDMPWHLPSDLRHFKTITLGKPVVMGRKTFESLGRPLPGRPNIVISRQPAYAPEGVEVAGSLADALARAADLAADLGADEIVVMGGGQIYAEAMALADRLEITEVRARPEGDTRFPAIDRDVWQETARVEGVRGEKDSACFCHVTWRRKDIPAPAQ